MAVVSYKCPNCDGELIFQPKEQDYKCKYCGTRFTQRELETLNRAEETEKKDMSAQDEPLRAEEDGTSETSKADAGEGAEAMVFVCPSCGAEIVTDATTAATFCYYCHNPVAIGKRLEGKFLPDRIIPFQIDKKEAEQRFLDYVGKKKFVPRAFFNKKQIEALTGVYFPYWVYDAEFNGKLSAEGRKVRVWRAGDEEFTETKIYQIERDGEVALGNLTENALQKANAELARGVMPYQFDGMKEFHMGYLSGFYAEKRDIERESVEAGMKESMQKSAERLMRETVDGYNSVTVNHFQAIPKKENWSYALFPVWTVTYKGRNGKMYYYSMNGQNGKVCGELPIDYRKLTVVSAVAAAAAFALVLIGGFFL